MEARALAQWSQNLGQKERDSARIRSAKGINKWPGSMVASWQRVGGSAHLGVEEETVKRADISGHCPLL
jgi:hypothetical protein